VWLAFAQGRQECWRFIVHLGAARPRETIDWPLMLPGEDCTGWLALDFETQFMKVNPQAAYADGEQLG